MKHQKHGKTTRLKMGTYGRFELAILGTNCANIKQLSSYISTQLSLLKIAYLDANHNKIESDDNQKFSTLNLDQQSYHQVDLHNINNNFDHKFLYQDQDIILINGNHFEATNQVVFLDRKKESSLLKRKDQLTNIRLFIQMEDDDYFPEFLNDTIHDEDNISIIRYDDLDKITNIISSLFKAQSLPIYGLVLAGGHSTRMGIDKGKIQYNGKDLRIHIYEELSQVVDQCYFSGRPDQSKELSDYPFIEDRMINMGPFGAILSAFMTNPNAAWIVVGCDMAKIETQAFSQLINQRDISKIATAFYSEKTGFPDPLPAIWEPKSYAKLLQFMSIGYSCPRKVLINSDVNIIDPDSQEWLFNMNTPEDKKEANL